MRQPSAPITRGAGRARLRLAALAAVVALAMACSPPVGVVRLDPREVREELTADVLTAGRPSTPTMIVLQRRGLREQWEKHPAETLAVLHRDLLTGGRDPELLAALAELSFDHAMHEGGRAYYLASVVYAWEFLFGDDAVPTQQGLDPRARLAANLYNIGLAEAFAAENDRVVLRAGLRYLPFGTLDVAFDEAQLRWGDRRLVDFVSAADLGVRGLHNRYRTAGIGAPLNAATEPLDPNANGPTMVGPRVRVPATALLRIDPGTGPDALLRARLELYAANDVQQVEIAGRMVPLEYEPTSALAQALAESPIWKREIRGFLHGDMLLGTRTAPRLAGLEPYRPDRIPVVLVHGTASSIGRWADMVNDLWNDPAIRAHFQIWAFTYDTGNPIVYSAMMLRDSLTSTVAEFDPRSEDPCLHQMVVIGHSQGGLLAKLTAVDSGDRFWRNLSDQPFDQVEMSEKNRALLRRALFVTPLPFVRRLVFIATPHGGSYRAGAFAQNLVQRLVSFPVDVARLGADLLVDSEGATAAYKARRLPTSVDNMVPGSPFLTALASMPVAPGVTTHSIIAVEGNGPIERGGDGIVKYTSAHIEGVASEVVVRSPHSCQSNPKTIEEVRRILLEHAAAVVDDGQCRWPDAS